MGKEFSIDSLISGPVFAIQALLGCLVKPENQILFVIGRDTIPTVRTKKGLMSLAT